MTAAEQWVIDIDLKAIGPEAVADLTALFPLNPVKQGRMKGYDIQTGMKACTTLDSPPQPEDLVRNLRLDGHVTRLGYLPGSTATTTVGMVDIDLKHYEGVDEFETVVTAVARVMNRYGVKWYREDSTNGGAHLWVFLSEGLGYGQVRDFLKTLIAEAGYPQLETFPAGDDASSKWVFIPYAGAEKDPENLGLTFLRDRHGRPIPRWQLEERVERTPLSVAVSVLANWAAVRHKEAQQTQTRELAPEGFAALKVTVLQPPLSFGRHDSAEAFLNLAEKMGRQDEMAEFLKSEEVYDKWFTEEKPRTTVAGWGEEIDRWLSAGSGHQYGIKFLLDQGWRIPDLPKVGESARQTDKSSWQQNFDALRFKYAAHTDESGTKKRIRRYRAHEVRNIPQLESLVGNLLIQRTLAALFGPSGAGKSMVGLDIALHVATGRDWREHKVSQGAVVWLAAESMEYTADRMEAWCNKRGVPAHQLPFDLLDGYLAITDVQPGGGLEELILELKEISAERGTLALIVVDTVARTFGDGDENKNDDMKHYTDAAELLTRIFNCTVLLIHHSGKDTARGARGASAFKAPLTTELVVEKAPKKTGGGVWLKQSKNRGAIEQASTRLWFESHSWKEDGIDRSSGVVSDKTNPVELNFSPELVLKGEQRKVYEILDSLSRNGEENDEMEWVPRDKWRDAYKADGGKEKTFNYELGRLLEDKHIVKRLKGKQEFYRPTPDDEGTEDE